MDPFLLFDTDKLGRSAWNVAHYYGADKTIRHFIEQKYK